MAKMFGINMTVKQGWMKKAVALLSEDLSETEYRNALEEHLKFELQSPTNIRKSREILMRIWFLDSDGVAGLQQEGRSLIQKYPDYLTEIGWCMVPLAYPIFFDYAKTMGKMLSFDDIISTGQVKQKMFDEIGERVVIDTATPKVITTMRELGAVCTQKPGKHSSPHIPVKNSVIINFMIRAAMFLDGSSYYPYSSLTEFPFLFPFNFSVSKEQLMQDQRFKLSAFDATLSVALKKG